MRRREFITLLGGAAAAWPMAATAQQLGRLPTIGYSGANSDVVDTARTTAFVRRMAELGWIEGRTVSIEFRWSEGRSERYTEIAAEFVRLKVDVIVVGATAPVIAAKRETSSIPIVFPLAADPVGTGLVASLARPGGNVTGLSLQTADLAGKRIELLREVAPGLARLAIIGNVGAPSVVAEMREVKTAAHELALAAVPIELRQAEDVKSRLETIKGHADAIYVCADPLVISKRAQIGAFSREARLPTIYIAREFVEAGGLMSYGPNFPDLYRRAAEFVDKILRGAKPADIPVEQPIKFDLVVNLKTAKALGLKIPEAFLLRADEVIE